MADLEPRAVFSQSENTEVRIDLFKSTATPAMNQRSNLWIPRANHRLWGDNGIYRGVVKTKDKAADTDRPDYPYSAASNQLGEGHLPASVSLGTWLPTRISVKVHGLHGNRRKFYHGTEIDGLYAIVITGDTIETYQIKDLGEMITLTDVWQSKDDGSKATKEKGKKQSKTVKKDLSAAIESEEEDAVEDSPTKVTTKALSESQNANPSKSGRQSKPSSPQSGDKRSSKAAGLPDNGNNSGKESKSPSRDMNELSKYLLASLATQSGIRVLRGGPKRESAAFPISFERGFRYDGLYVVTGSKCDPLSDGSRPWTWTLDRIPGQRALSAIQQSSPSAADLQDLVDCEEQWKDCRKNGWSMPT